MYLKDLPLTARCLGLIAKGPQWKLGSQGMSCLKTKVYHHWLRHTTIPGLSWVLNPRATVYM